jgi:hypothetical protein
MQKSSDTTKLNEFNRIMKQDLEICQGNIIDIYSAAYNIYIRKDNVTHFIEAICKSHFDKLCILLEQ